MVAEVEADRDAAWLKSCLDRHDGQVYVVHGLIALLRV
jgi:hypothetical protein